MDEGIMPLPTAEPTPNPTAEPTAEPTSKPTAEPKVKAKRKTSEYNLFRKYLVSKHHKLSQKDVGLMWNEINKPPYNKDGAESLWQTVRESAQAESQKNANKKKKKLNTDEGFLHYLQMDDTFNTEVSETLQQRFGRLAASRANDILDGSTDAKTASNVCFSNMHRQASVLFSPPSACALFGERGGQARSVVGKQGQTTWLGTCVVRAGAQRVLWVLLLCVLQHTVTALGVGALVVCVATSAGPPTRGAGRGELVQGE
jgi:hypothetical protein